MTVDEALAVVHWSARPRNIYIIVRTLAAEVRRLRTENDELREEADRLRGEVLDMQGARPWRMSEDD